MPPESESTIYIVDDDESVRSALEMLMLSAGMKVYTFASASDFLSSKPGEINSCLITDIKMKGIGGLELQQKLNDAGNRMPVIFLTAFDTKESRKQARRGGAAGYFRKPVDDQSLLDSIRWALCHDTR
jgi:FixJ family two-component response regulator